MTKEEERVREQVHKWLHDLWLTIEESYTEQEVDTKIGKLLSIPGVCIKADDQGLPLAGPFSLGEATNVRKAREDMLKPDKEGRRFVKVIEKK